MSSRRNGELEVLLHEQEMEDKEMELREREVAAMEKLAESIGKLTEDIAQIKKDTSSIWAYSQYILQSTQKTNETLNKIFGGSVYNGGAQISILR